MENFNDRDSDILSKVSRPIGRRGHILRGSRSSEMFEESLKILCEGEVLKGQVVQIGQEFVILDVGGKSEGRIPLWEFLDQNGNLTVKVGDQVEALLVRVDDEDGEMIFSKDKAAKIKVWEEITRIHNEDLTIRGLVTAPARGGLWVDIGVRAFLPGSQVDSRPIKNLESLIGQTYDFKILQYNKRRGHVVLRPDKREALRLPEALRVDGREDDLDAEAVLKAIKIVVKAFRQRFFDREENFTTRADGAVLKGQVARIGREFVMLNVGGKSEGRVPLREFLDQSGDLTVKVGDQVEVFLVREDDLDAEAVLKIMVQAFQSHFSQAGS